MAIKILDFDSLVTNPTILNIVWYLLSRAYVENYDDLFQVLKEIFSECNVFDVASGVLFSHFYNFARKGHLTVMMFDKRINNTLTEQPFHFFAEWYIRKLYGHYCFTHKAVYDVIGTRMVDTIRQRPDQRMTILSRANFGDLKPCDELIPYQPIFSTCTDDRMVRSVIKLALVLKIDINHMHTAYISHMWQTSPCRRLTTTPGQLTLSDLSLLRRSTETSKITQTYIRAFIQDNLRSAFGKRIPKRAMYERYVVWAREKADRRLQYSMFTSIIEKMFLNDRQHYSGIRFK